MGLLTYYDTVERLNDFAGLATIGSSVRDSKRAVVDAMRELANCHDWRYYVRERIFSTVASYSTGTLAYDHSGGSSERLLTISDGTWPSWIANGKIFINGTNPPYEVGSYIDSTNVQLSVNSNPGADVAAGTTFVAYRDSYPLPSDFVKFRSQLIDSANQYAIPNVTPKQWLNRVSVYNQPGEVFEFAVMASPNYLNTDAIYFSPPPSNAKEYRYLYHRRPRTLKVYSETTGTISVTSGNATVTGVGTSFSSKHVGSVIRFGNSTNVPTAIDGDYPYEMERIITAVASATSLTLDENADQTFAGVKYQISDPIDLQVGVMQNAFMRSCEKELANLRSQDRKADYNQIADMAMLRAIESDNRVGAAFHDSGSVRSGFTELILERGYFQEAS